MGVRARVLHRVLMGRRGKTKKRVWPRRAALSLLHFFLFLRPHMDALGDDQGSPPEGPAAFLAAAAAASNARLRRHLDAVAPHTRARWGGAAALLLAYVARVASLRSFHIVTYGLGIYQLNLFLGFITPAVRVERVVVCVRERER